MSGRWKPKHTVFCGKCGWNGMRAVAARPCPKCGHRHPRKTATKETKND